MWSNWKGTPQNWLILIGAVIAISVVASMIFRIFPWWVWIFIIIPMSGGWLAKLSERFGSMGSSQQQQQSSRRYDASRIPESVGQSVAFEDEKPKRNSESAEPREPRYVLGDDGELIELPVDERLSEPYYNDTNSQEKDADSGDYDADNAPRQRRRNDSDNHYDYV